MCIQDRGCGRRRRSAMIMANLAFAITAVQAGMFPVGGGALSITLIVVLAWLVLAAFGVRYIPNSRVGVVEKLWSHSGSVKDGRIIARGGEAGYQVGLLRGGVHLFLYRWQYRIHAMPLVTVPQGKVAYVYARDGQPLEPGQTLARVADCNNFQDAAAFLAHGGQRGRQRAILREGV